jgi:hypothetical protein
MSERQREVLERRMTERITLNDLAHLDCWVGWRQGARGEIRTITFSDVTDDTHVFDTLSGALLDLRLGLDIVPDLDVKIRPK